LVERQVPERGDVSIARERHGEAIIAFKWPGWGGSFVISSRVSRAVGG
jgi:hypothetical protein